MVKILKGDEVVENPYFFANFNGIDRVDADEA